jgi:hypothetical protein
VFDFAVEIRSRFARNRRRPTPGIAPCQGLFVSNGDDSFRAFFLRLEEPIDD